MGTGDGGRHPGGPHPSDVDTSATTTLRQKELSGRNLTLKTVQSSGIRSTFTAILSYSARDRRFPITNGDVWTGVAGRRMPLTGYRSTTGTYPAACWNTMFSAVTIEWGVVRGPEGKHGWREEEARGPGSLE